MLEPSMFKQKACLAAAPEPERALTTASHLLAAALIDEPDLAAVAAVARTFGIGEIGRASCRERVFNWV